jgi:hypothetical protein
MTPSAVTQTDAIEHALAHAAEVAVTWSIETQVFGDRDGSYRVAIGGVRPADDEVVVATVGANGEMLIYGLGRAA